MQTELGSDSTRGVQHSSAAVTLGMLYVVIGSSSYGMLSTIVKLAYQHGYTTAEITLSQCVLGAVGLTFLSFLLPKDSPRPTLIDARDLFISGIPTGLTGLFYYASVQYIDASIAVVILMQSVWIGVVIETTQQKRLPTPGRTIAVVLVLIGTLLATNAIDGNAKLDGRGLIFGFLAALSYSATMLATSSVAKHLPSIKRSQFMLFGGTFAALIFTFLTQVGPHDFGIRIIGGESIRNKAFDLQIFLSYGFVVAVFGTIIPPIMLNKGFPIVGVGLGSILSSAELPFAVMISFVFLGEIVIATQWLGIFLILFAIGLLNYRLIVPKDRSIKESN